MPEKTDKCQPKAVEVEVLSNGFLVKWNSLTDDGLTAEMDRGSPKGTGVAARTGPYRPKDSFALLSGIAQVGNRIVQGIKKVFAPSRP